MAAADARSRLTQEYASKANVSKAKCPRLSVKG
jgi:hypothetical protein